MGRICALLLVLLACCWSAPAGARTPYQDEGEIRSEAARDFETILDLWREGRYDDLYERTTSAGRVSRESFGRRLAAASRRPACCWEKVQEMRITVRDDSTVTVRARVGLEGGTAGTEFATRSFRLVKEEGVWRLPASEILSLAGAKKGGSAAKKKRPAD